MIYEKINIKDFYNLNYDVFLEAFVVENLDCNINEKPGILILPGGGYTFVSKREGDPVAMTFLLKGYNCFKLTYTVVDENHHAPIYPNPQLEALAAFDFIKKNSKKYMLNDKLFVMGFSAGGHLAGSYGYLYKNQELVKLLNINDIENNKPSGLCLCYPVIVFNEKTHVGSKVALTNNNNELIELLSIEKHVDSNYPPTFIWTTEDDTCVPYENTLIMQKTLNDNCVKNKTVIYKSGNHGLSIATELVNTPNEEITNWVNECDNFFKSL